MFYKFKKGSPEAREFMARLRAMRGKKKRKKNPLDQKETSASIRRGIDDLKWARKDLRRRQYKSAAMHAGMVAARGSEIMEHAEYSGDRYKGAHLADLGLRQIGRAYAGKSRLKKNPPLLVLGNPKTSKKARQFISKKIRKLRHEGYPAKQSEAIAYRMARKRRMKVGRRKNPDYGPCPPGCPPNIWRDPAFQREVKIFRSRHGANVPIHVSRVNMPPGSPKFMTAYGRASHAVYDAPKQRVGGNRFKHHFGKAGKNKPWLVSSASKGPKWLGYAGGTFQAKNKWLYS